MTRRFPDVVRARDRVGTDASARVRALDGSQVGPEPVVQPLLPGDTATIQAVFDGLTPEQRRQRFHVPMTRLPQYMHGLLADVDGTRHVALVLRIGGRPAGLARYVVTGVGEAELAVEVVAEHAGRGHGRLLLEELLAHARRNGLVRLRFELLAENEPARRLLAHYCVQPRSHGGKYYGTVPTSHAALVRGVDPGGSAMSAHGLRVGSVGQP